MPGTALGSGVSSNNDNHNNGTTIVLLVLASPQLLSLEGMLLLLPYPA